MGVLLCTSHLYPRPNWSHFLSPGKSPELRGQICGKIPAKSPGFPEAVNSWELFFNGKNMREGLELLYVNVQVHLQIKKVE